VHAADHTDLPAIGDVLRGGQAVSDRGRLELPLLVTHGRADTVVLPAMAEHVLANCPTAEPSWYEGVGHTAHLEEPERFNRELAALTRRVQHR
jgi:pimeloyl-ACP methyl ester carboxylesterase